VTEQSYAEAQLDVFDTGFRFLQEQLRLPSTTERHFAASAATMVLPKARFDVVRIGVSLYGLWPSTETRISARLVLDGVPALEPVLTWKCPSQTVKRLPAGAYVGYGCTWRCPVETTIAVLPVGYSDGYPRLLSSRAHVLVNGARCPVIGRVMMNHIVVDISRAAPSGGPILATLLGRDGSESVPAELLADWAQTINYEVVARLGAHLKRVVIGEA
jgi:alanine racemase